MLYAIAVVLIVLWLLGLVTSYTLGGVIHVLLVIAVVLILVQVIQGRRLYADALRREKCGSWKVSLLQLTSQKPDVRAS